MGRRKLPGMEALPFAGPVPLPLPPPPIQGQGRILLVGLSASGLWVARDREGLIGGLFKSREAAMRFALFETDHAPNAVLFVPEGLELSLTQANDGNRHAPSNRLPQ